MSGYTDKQLLAGVICCGGGINLKGFEEAIIQKPQLAKVRLAVNTITKVDWDTATCPESGTQGVLVGLLMDGAGCCQENLVLEIAPEDEKRAVTGDLFTADGESAQAKRDEELKELRQKKIMEAEAKKAQMQAKASGFFTGFVKKIKLASEKLEKGIDDFLKDDDNNK